MNLSQPRFLVVGLGPVGGIFATMLKAAGVPVTGVDVNDEHRQAIRKNGLSVSGVVSRAAHLDDVVPSLSALKTNDFDYVVLAVKAPVTLHLVPELLAMGGTFKIVSMQNGIDNEEFLAHDFGRDRTMRIVVNFAGIMNGPGAITMTFFNRPNYVGCLCQGEECEHARQLAGLMTEAGLESEATADIKRYVWLKTILNAALTPVCAVLGMTMAQVMDCKETYRLVELILDECIKVAHARGYDFGQGFLDYCLDYLSRAGEHMPSMYADLHSGRTTEIDMLNGRIVKHGARLGVHVPVNKTLTALVKARESKNNLEE